MNQAEYRHLTDHLDARLGLNGTPHPAANPDGSAETLDIGTPAPDPAPAAGRTKVSPPAVRLLRGDDVKLEAVPWLWKDFLPAGMLTLIGGAPGCGKTTIALSLAAVVTLGGAWPDGTPGATAGDVLVWSGEDPAAVLAARLTAAGADMSRVHFVAGITGDKGGSFDPGRDMAALEEAAKALPAVRLLILDPIVSAVTGDGHKSNDVRRSLQPVVDLAARLGCAVLGITHFSKGTAGRDPVERITGSLAYAALARVVLVAAKVRRDGDGDLNGANGEPRRVLVRAKSNVGPDGGGFAYALERVPLGPGLEGQRVRWLHALAGSAQEVLAEAEGEAMGADVDAQTDVEAFVHACLDDGPIPSRNFERDAEGAGFQWRTVQRVARRLGASSKKDGMQGGWNWGFHDAPKATDSPEGDEGDREKKLSPSSPSLSPSVDEEVD